LAALPGPPVRREYAQRVGEQLARGAVAVPDAVIEIPGAGGADDVGVAAAARTRVVVERRADHVLRTRPVGRAGGAAEPADGVAWWRQHAVLGVVEQRGRGHGCCDASSPCRSRGAAARAARASFTTRAA